MAKGGAGASISKARRRIHQIHSRLRNLASLERELAPDFEKGIVLEIKAGVGRERASLEAELGYEIGVLEKARKYRRSNETES